MRMAGLIALTTRHAKTPPHWLAELDGLGVRAIMVTGDAEITARVVAASIGIKGPDWAKTPIPDDIKADTFPCSPASSPRTNTVSSRRFRNRAYRRHVRRTVPTTPGLTTGADGYRRLHRDRRRQIIRRHRADRPGLKGIVTAVKVGRATFQRILTYTLRTIIHKTTQVLFLTFGLIITGQAILTPC